MLAACCAALLAGCGSDDGGSPQVQALPDGRVTRADSPLEDKLNAACRHRGGGALGTSVAASSYYTPRNQDRYAVTCMDGHIVVVDDK